MTKKGRIFYGWWMILAMDAMIMYNAGVWIYGLGAFIDPIQNELGWTRAEISLGISLQKIEAGFENFYMG